jgi:hypothetical protein
MHDDVQIGNIYIELRSRQFSQPDSFTLAPVSTPACSCLSVSLVPCGLRQNKLLHAQINENRKALKFLGESLGAAAYLSAKFLFRQDAKQSLACHTVTFSKLSNDELAQAFEVFWSGFPVEQLNRAISVSPRNLVGKCSGATHNRNASDAPRL